MTSALDNTAEILGHLVGFETISGRPTHEIVGYIKDYLAGHGIEASLSYDEVGERANVFVSHAWGDRFCDVIAAVYVSCVFF